MALSDNYLGCGTRTLYPSTTTTPSLWYTTPKWTICATCGGDGEITCNCGCDCCNKRTCVTCGGSGKVRNALTPRYPSITWNDNTLQSTDPITINGVNTNFEA